MRVSNRWKKQGSIFQSLENNGVMSFQSLEKFPIIGKTVFCLLAASAFALSAPAMTYYMNPTGSGDGASWDEAEPVS